MSIKKRKFSAIKFFVLVTVSVYERRGGLMLSALDSRSSGLGSSPGRDHCVVFLGISVFDMLMLGVTLQ